MFTIGADPEFFLCNASGALKSCIGLIGGTKDFPQSLKALGKGFAVQEDNVAVEFNIPPATTEDDFVNSIHKTLKHLQETILKDYFVSRSSAEEFPDTELNHPLAQVFGCDPDFNAWKEGKVNPRPHSTNKNLRSAGGHIHVGHTFDSKKQMLAFIKRMDLFTAIPSLLLDQGELRRLLYGKAGAFRPKSYGAEYRTLSNFWIFDSTLVQWIYNNTRSALVSLIDVPKDVETIINTNNKQKAYEYIKQFNIPMPV